ncbi:uncharacterized protein FTOL_09191 [Fusarium torulosum]|uniref:Uncharacterized protein n=1 Tax=Fusarium torulosum TaxID=33205 RepID=A0AAE8SKS9_9HYPO|nr:uncharacterized protein FTOL_09191 [Fusarium torulosum]
MCGYDELTQPRRPVTERLFKSGAVVSTSICCCLQAVEHGPPERDLAILSQTLLIQHSWGTKPSHNDLTEYMNTFDAQGDTVMPLRMAGSTLAIMTP